VWRVLYFANVMMRDAIEGMRYVCILQNSILRSLVQGDDQLVRPHFIGMYAPPPPPPQSPALPHNTAAGAGREWGDPHLTARMICTLLHE
jgi:hypothetical protein